VRGPFYRLLAFSISRTSKYNFPGLKHIFIWLRWVKIKINFSERCGMPLLGWVDDIVVVFYNRPVVTKSISHWYYNKKTLLES